MANIDKLNKLASNNSNWIQEANERRENRVWQKHSQKIAIKVLKAIREKGIKQKQLAEMIGVSPQQINKIVKGNENLTLVTIAKLENALNIKLIFTEIQKSNIIYRDIVEKTPVYFALYRNTKTVSQQTSTYSIKQDIFPDKMEFEKAV